MPGPHTPDPSGALPRSTPESQGIASAAMLAFVAAAAERYELHSVMVLRHGHVIAEGWSHPYRPDGVQLLYSLSKSFTSTAIGIAQQEGLLTVDDRVSTFFPERVGALDDDAVERLDAMTVGHLLSMASGHVDDTLEPARAIDDLDWARGILAVPTEHAPGTHFAYNNGATHVLSAIVQKVSGVTLLDYLRPRLLDPLGIGAARWDAAPNGVDYGFSGLHLTTEAVARLGLLYLHRGLVGETRVLTEEWVDAATSMHVSTAGEENPDWAQGYGYQFWRSRHDSYRGDGAYGQFCVVLPDRDAVVVTTAATEDMQGLLDLVWEHLLPAMGDAPLAAPADDDPLSATLHRLEIEPAPGAAERSRSADILGLTHRVAAPAALAPVESVTIEAGDAAAPWTLQLATPRGVQAVRCGFGEWHPNVFAFGEFAEQTVFASAAWHGGRFVAELLFVETPHRLRIEVRDAEAGGTRLGLSWNVDPLW